MQNGFQQGGVSGGRFLGDGGDAGAGAQADLAAIQRLVADDGAQQRRLAGAIPADQPDAAALVHREVGTVQDAAPAQADGGAGYGKEGHGGGVIGRVGVAGQALLESRLCRCYMETVNTADAIARLREHEAELSWFGVSQSPREGHQQCRHGLARNCCGD